MAQAGHVADRPLLDPSVPIDLILHAPGALALAAEQIAQALRRHRAKVTVFVPHYAMSGATLVALAADEIVVADNAVPGPVVPQLDQSPAASIVEVIERTPIAGIDDGTVIQADIPVPYGPRGSHERDGSGTVGRT